MENEGVTFEFAPFQGGPLQMHRKADVGKSKGWLTLTFVNPHPLETKVIQNWDLLGRGEFGSPQVEIVIQMTIFLNAERWGRKPLPVRKWTGQSGPVGSVFSQTEYHDRI